MVCKVEKSVSFYLLTPSFPRMYKLNSRSSRLSVHMVLSDVARAHITQHPQPSDLVHEQRRDDVARQHSQGAQETDKVDHVGIVIITDIAEQAAFFVVQESAVHELAVDQPILKEICGERRGREGL